MGSVWEATLLSLDIPCAVKFIDSEFVGHAETQARFEREAKAAAQLRSPHVVQVIDHGICQGRPYIAMELLVGEDLGKRLKRRGRLSSSEVLPIVEQVSRALTKAHGAGIVHRDLKPDNIFLVRDDDREIVKVLDFGIAKSVDEAHQEGLTRVGALLGTPHYMSPEQAQGSKDVDHRSDLWSLAVIIFRCLTGRFPFAGKGLGEILVQILKDDLPIPSQAAPDLPPAFDGWWARGVSRDPSLRFQSARELTDALAVALNLSKVPDPAESRPALPEPKAHKGGTALMPQMTGPPAQYTHGGRAGTQPLAAMTPPTPSMIVPHPSMSDYGPPPAAYGPPPPLQHTYHGQQGQQQPYGTLGPHGHPNAQLAVPQQPFGQAYPSQNTTAPTTTPAIPTADPRRAKSRDGGMLATKIIGILLAAIAVVLGIVVIVAYTSKDPVIGRPPSVRLSEDLQQRRTSPSVILSTGPVPIQPPPITSQADASAPQKRK